MNKELRAWLRGPWPWLLVSGLAMARAEVPQPPPPEPEELRARYEARKQERLEEMQAWLTAHGDHTIPWSQAEGHLAIMVDDLGRELQVLSALADLPIQLSFSILPGAIYGHGTQLRLRSERRHYREIWLHLPLEPMQSDLMGPEVELGETFLTRAQTDGQRLAALEVALARVPTAVGVNHHMGSALSSERAALVPLMRRLAQSRLLYVDSRTTHLSVAEEVARTEGVPTARRHVFLDHVRERDAIARALDEAIERSLSEPTIAIAHPSWDLVEVLRSRLETLAARKVGIYPASRLVAHFEGLGFPQPADGARLSNERDAAEHVAERHSQPKSPVGSPAGGERSRVQSQPR